MVEVRLAKQTDISNLFLHLKRHTLESGTDGDLIFAPYEEPRKVTEVEFHDEKNETWGRPLTEVGWERCWIVADNRGVCGELKLVHHIPLKSALHRATLMMGIERSHRGQGLGKQLVAAALEWATEQTTLEWIDLGVFAHNAPAIALYSKFGFIQTGRVDDLFRVKGQKIDDLQMTLKL